MKFDRKDVECHTYRSGKITQGENSIKMVHIPTGITIESSESRFYFKNYEDGMDRLQKLVENKI